MVRMTLVTGGARSGKSDYAERLARALGGDDVTFIATATADDDEMAARIACHRAARPAAWTTVESRRHAAAAVRAAATSVVLLDCLTLLASNALLDADRAASNTGGPDGATEDAARAAVRVEAEALVRACAERDRDGTVIVVTNEVGLGIVPATRLGRLFRDALGEANRIVADAADRVVLMVSGIPLTVR
jgi:adenosyl cobinamide kinase/adenosyl cobinamide phosphate guanylyltransferase